MSVEFPIQIHPQQKESGRPLNVPAALTRFMCCALGSLGRKGVAGLSSHRSDIGSVYDPVQSYILAEV